MNPIEHELLQMLYLKIDPKFIEKYKTARIYVYHEPNPDEWDEPDCVMASVDRHEEPNEGWLDVYHEFRKLEDTYELEDGRVFQVQFETTENHESISVNFSLIELPPNVELQKFMFLNDTKRDVTIHPGVRIHGIRYEGDTVIKHLEVKTFYLPSHYVPLIKMWDYDTNLSIMILNGASSI